MEMFKAAKRAVFSQQHGQVQAFGTSSQGEDDLPSPLLSWALDPTNPTLSAGRERAKRAVIGGVSAKPRIREMSPQEVAAEVYAALQDTGGIRMMIGPNCSISPDTPEANLRAARAAVDEWASRR